MLSRRSFLRCSFSPRGPQRDVLVQVFLRGGADGLGLVPPVGDEAYHKARPTLAIARPDARGEHAIDLDGFFGLHPAMAPLMEAFRDKQLAIVHAAGSADETRSHFEAQDLMERGCPVNREMGSGWIARHLRTAAGDRSALSAVAIAETMPESLRGSPGASAVRSLDEFVVDVPSEERAQFTTSLRKLYSSRRDELGAAGLQVLETVATVERLRREGERVPETSLTGDLRQVARLIRAEVGLEVACVDLNGWDHHFVESGAMRDHAGELANGIATFWRELGEFRARVTLVAVTEFGRRVQENVSLGTDHGRGSVMLVLGGGIRGGKVYAKWPGLGADVLEGPGDLPVTTDYRDVLAEIVEKRLGNPRVTEIFPERPGRSIGLVG